MDINQEITKHLEWIEAVASLIGDQPISTEQIREVSRHDRCGLGRWLNSAETVGFKDFPEFEKLEERHRAFHMLAGDVITAIESGNHDQAVASGEAFVATSRDVIGYLDALREHARGSDGHGPRDATWPAGIQEARSTSNGDRRAR